MTLKDNTVQMADMSKRMLITELIATEEYRIKLYEKLKDQEPENHHKKLVRCYGNCKSELKSLIDYQGEHNGR